jgi:hypothetical protein
LQAKYEEELKMMQDELTRHNNDYEKNKKKMSKKDQKAKEDQLQTMYLKIQQYFNDCQADLNKFAQKTNEKKNLNIFLQNKSLKILSAASSLASCNLILINKIISVKTIKTDKAIIIILS